jgi:hypothetical protein
MVTAIILASLQAPASPPVATPTPVGPELVIDLAKVAPGSPVSLAAPAVIFDVRLENAAPGVGYRTKVEIAGARPSVRTKTINGAPENMLRPFATREPGCEALQRESQAVLRSTEEAEVPGRTASVERLLGEHGCPSLEPMVRGQMRQTRPHVNAVNLNPLPQDAVVTVTVERLDRATGAVQKTWRVTSTLPPGTPIPTPAPSVARGGGVPADPFEARPNPFQTERIVYRSEIRSMLGKRRFKELEGRASALRTGKDRFSSGISKLVEFYQGLGPVGETPPKSASAPFEEVLKAWQTQYPASIAPRNGLIRLERKRAFAARGLEFAPKVTEEGWRGWKEHLKRAWDLVAAAEAIKEKDAAFFSLLVDLCLGGDCPRERAERFLRAGLAIDPSYDDLYVAMANYLLPRWHGSVDAFTRFAARSADESRAYLGDIAYVRIATVALLAEGDGMPQLYPGLSWERIKRGLADLDQRFPNAARTRYLRAKFACAYQDRPTATAVFQAMGGPVWDKEAEEMWFRPDRLQQCYDAWARRPSK